MQKQGHVILKPGKEKPILNRHHWIFSGAIDTMCPSFKDGEFLSVYSSNKDLLGSGYFNRKSTIIGRMISFDETPPLQKIQNLLQKAFETRQKLLNVHQTNAYRLVNGEGDGLPGLIIDVYDQTAVFQSSTKGIDLLKSEIVCWLQENIKPTTIYEKSRSHTRREEGLQDIEGFLSGEQISSMSFKENDLLYTASLKESQKTGFFLDHREMRLWIKELSKGKRVLNAFSYTGGFSVAALSGGAVQVDSVDISAEAIRQAREHVVLNGFDATKQGFFCEDVFDFLRQRSLPYDLVILDPPAFAKRKKDVVSACRGYKDINRLVIQKILPGSILLTSSCSYHVPEDLFQKILFQAAIEAKREVQIIGHHRLAMDHPMNVFHPEGDYLKSLLLFIH